MKCASIVAIRSSKLDFTDQVENFEAENVSPFKSTKWPSLKSDRFRLPNLKSLVYQGLLRMSMSWGCFNKSITQELTVIFFFNLSDVEAGDTQKTYTPKFNSSPLKNGGWKTTFLLGR